MDFTEHVIKKGRHYSTPIQFSYAKVGYEEYECYFENSAAYDHGNANQHDLNKGPGRSMCFWTNHKDSYMLGWRYSLVSEMFELTSYYHIGGNRFMGPGGLLIDSFPELPFRMPSGSPHTILSVMDAQVQSWEVKAYQERVFAYYARLQSVQIMASVKPYERFRLGLYKDFDKGQFGINIWTEPNGWVRDKKQFSRVRKRQRYINWWFGGNPTAPHDVLIQDRKIIQHDI